MSFDPAYVARVEARRKQLSGHHTALELHRFAMELADDADNIRRAGDHKAADIHLVRALQFEREAALATTEEPSRSVLLRSAASLALELKQLREAERLVAIALSAEPPPVIADELRDGVTIRLEELVKGQAELLKLAKQNVRADIDAKSLESWKAMAKERSYAIDRLQKVLELLEDSECERSVDESCGRCFTCRIAEAVGK